jgi:hypothetical protein
MRICWQTRQSRFATRPGHHELVVTGPLILQRETIPSRSLHLFPKRRTDLA